MSPLCDEMALPVGPGVAFYQAGDLGAPHRICVRDEVGFGGGGVIVNDSAHFYGHIIATGDLSGSFALGESTELFANAEVVRSDGILGAIAASSLAPGHLSLGVMHALPTSEKADVGFHGRLVLPTAVGVYQNALPFGFDLAMGTSIPLSGRLYLHADTGFLGQVVFGGGTGGLRLGVGMLSGLEWRAGKAFGMVLDLHGGFGFADSVDDVSVAPAFRFAGGKHFGAELALFAPIIGRDRAPMIAADLRLSWRL
jgi:hypothetical protein